MSKKGICRPPLIIIGMHRSGTSMITNILEESGLFTGIKKDQNGESIFFSDLNTWLLREANASWDNPYNFQFVNSSFVTEATKILEIHLKRFFSRVKFLGFKKSFRFKNIKEVNVPWGWKDPRNTFTIDVWKEIFPEAKVLHIFRNPIDVAQSLRTREFKYRDALRFQSLKKFKWRLKRFLLKGKILSQYSARVEHISQGIQLWEEYVNKAFALDDIFRHRIMHVKYEDFLQAPEQQLTKILEFTELKLPFEKLKFLIRRINPDRKMAFLQNEQLVRIYNKLKNKEIIKKLEYDEVI